MVPLVRFKGTFCTSFALIVFVREHRCSTAYVSGCRHSFPVTSDFRLSCPAFTRARDLRGSMCVGGEHTAKPDCLFAVLVRFTSVAVAHCISSRVSGRLTVFCTLRSNEKTLVFERLFLLRCVLFFLSGMVRCRCVSRWPCMSITSRCWGAALRTRTAKLRGQSDTSLVFVQYPKSPFTGQGRFKLVRLCSADISVLSCRFRKRGCLRPFTTSGRIQRYVCRCWWPLSTTFHFRCHHIDASLTSLSRGAFFRRSQWCCIMRPRVIFACRTQVSSNRKYLDLVSHRVRPPTGGKPVSTGSVPAAARSPTSAVTD